jgi:hypothetical protein
MAGVLGRLPFLPLSRVGPCPLQGADFLSGLGAPLVASTTPCSHGLPDGHGQCATSLALWRLLCAFRQGVVQGAARSTEHERVRDLTAPDLQAPLHRTHQTIRITSRICLLQPF